MIVKNLLSGISVASKRSELKNSSILMLFPIITANDDAYPGATEHFELHLKGIIDLQQTDFAWG